MGVHQLLCLMLWACLFLLPLLPPPTSAAEEWFCAAVLYTHFKASDPLTPISPDVHLGGPSSLGFSQWYHPDLNSFWAANHARHNYRDPTLGTDDQPTMDIYAVGIEGDPNPLPGWLHLHLRRKVDTITIPILSVWSTTEERESVGEFVNRDKECAGDQGTVKSSTSGAVHKWLPPASVMPCAGTPVFYPKNPNMVVYSNKGVDKDGVLHVHLLWKLDQTACDNVRTDGFRFWVAIPPRAYRDAGVATTGDGYKLDVGKSHGRDPGGTSLQKFPSYGPYVYHTGIIKPKFYGAAAALPDAAKLRCFDGDSIRIKKPDWIESYTRPTSADNGELKIAEPKKWFNEPNPPNTGDDTNEALRWRCSAGGGDCPNFWPNENEVIVNRHRQTCKPWGDKNTPSNVPGKREYKPFWGRCKEEVIEGARGGIGTGHRVTPVDYHSPKCPHGTVNIKSPTEHYAYVTNTLPGELKKDGCDCPKEPDLDELNGPRSNAQDDSTEPESGCKLDMTLEEFDLLGLCKDSVVGMEAFSTREWHARTMLAAILMMIPISCYVARYQKGQLPAMDHHGEMVLPLGKWYTLHFYMTLFIGCMFGSALGAIGSQVVTLGYSLNPSAALHRYLGWGIFGTFLLQIFTGWLRPLNVTCRRVVIWLHWGCGVFVYYGGASLCIMSYKIPSSPFSFQSHLDPEFHNFTYHLPSLILLVWLAMDLVFHGNTMAYIIRFDRKHNVILGIGKYFPILLPVGLRYYRSCTDEQLKNRERNLRRMAYGYTALCVLTFFVLILVMDFVPHKENHGFGPMECTHDKDGHYNSEDPSITGADGRCPDPDI